MLAVLSRNLRGWIGLALLGGLWAAAPLGAATSITQFGITWTFDRDYASGQFANGDYWVVGPVTITDITPRSMTAEGVTLHGSMINPVPNTPQAFDSRIKSNTFDNNRNVAAAFPLTVPAGSSILSAESHLALASGNDPQLKTIAILTVLAAAPVDGSFRPPYAGNDKSVRWNKAQLDYSKLRSLTPVAATPALTTVEALFEKPFIDIRSSWAGTYVQPTTNHPAYGREIAHQVGAGLLSLQLNYSNAQKERLLIRLVQRGIDIHGLAALGATWNADGGHRHGRKPLLLLAGAVLNDAAILSYADARQHFLFQEDQQTFHVASTDVQRARRTSDGKTRASYTSEMIGLPEWGIRHSEHPDADDANWSASYRTVVGASTVGNVLAARLMGLETAWNWPALFDYVDRYYQIESSRTTTDTNSIQPFVKAMWTAYRHASPTSPATPGTTPKPSATPPSTPSAPAATPEPLARLVNLSARGRTGQGESVMIAGFVLGGSQPRPVLVRAVGAGLTAFGVKSPLPDSRLVLYRGTTKIAESDNWATEPSNAAIANASARVGAFALQASHQDAAFMATLEPGAYSVHVHGAGSATGVALVEVYDAGDGTATPTTPRLINLSTRGHVGAGDDILIAGLAITGDAPKRVLVRAVGPTLGTFGVPNALADPELKIFNGSNVIHRNDDWSGAAEIASAGTVAGAFALPVASKDAAIVVTLPPGNYTAHVEGKSGSTGIALVEVYELP